MLDIPVPQLIMYNIINKPFQDFANVIVLWMRALNRCKTNNLSLYYLIIGEQTDVIMTSVSKWEHL